MERIEYLLKHPSAVEGNDLELLNNEIEKYPYFYSLRALKLAALKKIKDDSFDNLLPLTATYSNNRKDLFYFINEKHNQVFVEATPKDEVLPIVEDEMVFENISDKNDLTKEPIEDFDNSIEEYLPENLVVEDAAQNAVNFSETTESTKIEDLTEDILTTNEIETSLEETIVVLDNEDNNVQSSESEIDKLIEEIKNDQQISNTTDELIHFDLPTSEDILPEIESSVIIAENVLNHNNIVDKGILETIELNYQPNQNKEKNTLQDQQEIEQVNLINRIDENNISSENLDKNYPKVSNINIFQIQNPYDIVKRKIELEQELISVNNNNLNQHIDLDSVHEKDTDKKIDKNPDLSNEVNAQSTDINKAEDVTLTIQPEAEEILVKEEIKPTSLSVSNDSSLSFNEWLKKSDDAANVSAQKEMKYQIIDSFLEKNPKITPIKKIDIPESKLDIKEIKQTDFSDLMTETLAQIYIEQKQFEKAIKAYKILSLKYPEKNSLFANQIKEIENLKNSK